PKLQSRLFHHSFIITVHVTIDMNLPVDGLDRLEIIDFTATDASQPVAAFIITAYSPAHLTVAVADVNLRHRFKQSLSHIVELQQPGNKDRHDKVSQPLPVHHELEQPVRRIDKCAGKYDSFAFIRIKDGFRSLFFQYRTQFPCQIDGITDAGVHPLTTGGAVNMSGITDDEDAAGPEFICDPVMGAVRGIPIHFL